MMPLLLFYGLGYAVSVFLLIRNFGFGWKEFIAPLILVPFGPLAPLGCWCLYIQEG